jgi:hypothetical protein
MKQLGDKSRLPYKTSYEEVSNRPENEKQMNLERRMNEMKISKICPALQHRPSRRGGGNRLVIDVLFMKGCHTEFQNISQDSSGRNMSAYYVAEGIRFSADFVIRAQKWQYLSLKSTRPIRLYRGPSNFY